MRCVIVEDDENAGPIVCSPTGGPLVYADQFEAGAAATSLRDSRGGAFYVQKLTTFAVYSKPRIQ